MQNTLYTFRRCPYAIRARLAIYAADFDCTEIEVDLKNKPEHLLKISPKGTVPVLHTEMDDVIDESIDIIKYVLAFNDDEPHLLENTPPEAWALIQENDTAFKAALDRYKYPNRYEDDGIDHAAIADAFLTKLDGMLKLQPFLYGEEMTIADIAIFPFIRQYRGVNSEAFDTRKDWDSLQSWVNAFLASDAFNAVMKKN